MCLFRQDFSSCWLFRNGLSRGHIVVAAPPFSRALLTLASLQRSDYPAVPQQDALCRGVPVRGLVSVRRATPEGLCFIHSVAPPPNARVLSIMPFMTSTILLYVTVKERVTVTSDNGLPRSSLRLLTLWPIVRERGRRGVLRSAPGVRRSLGDQRSVVLNFAQKVKRFFCLSTSRL